MLKYDYAKLKGKIIEKHFDVVSFAQALGISRKSLDDKLNCKRYWKVPEIVKAVDLLDLSMSDIPTYFFTT